MADIIAAHVGENSDGNLTQLVTDVGTIMPLPKDFDAEALAEMKANDIEDRLVEQAESLYKQRQTELGNESIRMLNAF